MKYFALFFARFFCFFFCSLIFLLFLVLRHLHNHFTINTSALHIYKQFCRFGYSAKEIIILGQHTYTHTRTHTYQQRRDNWARLGGAHKHRASLFYTLRLSFAANVIPKCTNTSKRLHRMPKVAVEIFPISNHLPFCYIDIHICIYTDLLSERTIFDRDWNRTNVAVSMRSNVYLWAILLTQNFLAPHKNDTRRMIARNKMQLLYVLAQCAWFRRRKKLRSRA